MAVVQSSELHSKVPEGEDVFLPEWEHKQLRSWKSKPKMLLQWSRNGKLFREVMLSYESILHYIEKEDKARITSSKEQWKAIFNLTFQGLSI